MAKTTLAKLGLAPAKRTNADPNNINDKGIEIKTATNSTFSLQLTSIPLPKPAINKIISAIKGFCKNN
ncbi:MAG: hypothetical protein ACPLIG_02615 [Candidatus Bathyarchaeales archaeon]